jgi:putative DNA primase/helicase
MTIHDDARLLGGEVFARNIRCPGPGHSPNDRSLSLKPWKKYVFHSFAGDDWKVCADYIRVKLGLPEFRPGVTYPQPQVRRQPEEEVHDNTEAVRKVWREATDIRGRLAGDLDWHRVLRFHKKCRFQGKNYPAMIALFRDCLRDEPRAIQRTLLTREGRKIWRAILGPVKGCAIKIDRLDGDHLCIGEGLETVLAGRIFGCMPAWALGSAGAIASACSGSNPTKVLVISMTHG